MSARRLTPNEITKILNDFQPIKSKYKKNSDLSTSNFKIELRKVLEGVKLIPAGLEEFTRRLVDQYNKKIIKINKRVGSLVSEALTDDLTQDALDGKKNTGTSKFKIGALDILKEIVEVTANTKVPATNIYFKTDVSFNYVESKKIDILSLTLGDLAKDYTLPENSERYFEDHSNSWYSKYEQLYDMKPPDDFWFVRITLDVGLMYKYKITHSVIIESIKEQKENLFESYFSPIITDENGEMVIYMDLYAIESGIMEIKKKIPKISKLQSSVIPYIFLKNIFLPAMDELVIRGIKNITDYVIYNVSIIGGFAAENEIEKGLWKVYFNWGWLNYNLLSPNVFVELFKKLNLKINIITENYIKVFSKIRPSIVASDAHSTLIKKETQYTKAQQEKKKKLLEIDDQKAQSITFKPPAITGGTDVYFQKYYAITVGINFTQLLLLDYIDTNRTYSDDLIETYNHFGISITRNLIITRIYRIFKSIGLWIDPRHIILLADYMCFNGDINKIGFFGAKKRGVGVFNTASLGSPLEVFSAMALFGVSDPVTYAPTAIVTGTKIKSYYNDVDTKEIEELEDEDFDIDELTDFLENSALLGDEIDISPESTFGEITETIVPEEDIKKTIPYLMFGTGLLTE